VTALCFILFFDNMNARIVAGALIFCVQTGLGLWLIVRHYRGTPGRGQFIVMSGYLVVLSVLLARVLAVGSGYIEIPSIFSETQLQQLSFLGVILALLLLSSGLVLMVQERSAAALLASRERLAKQNVALRRSARELEEANAKLESLSNTDPLTGLFNRRYFDRQLAIEGARAQRHGHSFAVIMIDIDHFKKFNDRYGHPAGDACLVKVAAALQAGLRRAGDVLARLGGEEFVVILSETDAIALATLANQLLRQVHDLRLPHEDAPEEVVTLSLGAALAESLQGIDPAFVLQRADEALYAAKQTGRNRVVVFSAGSAPAQENAA
jgi:diguanylate cyclase (GGDEF)-like protein